MMIKKSTLTILSLCGMSLFVNAEGNTDTETWPDLSDPRAVYSSVSVAGGNEGVNLSASYGGYLNGLYKHKITVEAINDLDYYNLDYLIVNASTNTGFSFESSWGRDLWDYDDVNDTSIGVFTKIPLMDGQLNVHPKLDLGMLWGDDISSTTYIKLDATTRYKINRMFWVGITPTYTYAMKGEDVKEWDASLDAGVQLTNEFAFSAHVNNDEEFWVEGIFTF
jgi:hypothetical protein